MPPLNQYYLDLARRARETYGSDDVQIDGESESDFSDADKGVWVKAWVWVADDPCPRCLDTGLNPNDAAEGDTRCPECGKSPS